MPGGAGGSHGLVAPEPRQQPVQPIAGAQALAGPCSASAEKVVDGSTAWTGSHASSGDPAITIAEHEIADGQVAAGVGDARRSGRRQTGRAGHRPASCVRHPRAIRAIQPALATPRRPRWPRARPSRPSRPRRIRSPGSPCLRSDRHLRHEGEQCQGLVVGTTDGNEVVGHALFQRGIRLQRDGHVLPAGPHLERIVPGVEDDVVGRVPEVDPLEQVLFVPGDADVDASASGAA